MRKRWLVTYYTDRDGSKPVEKYLRELPVNERAKALAFINLLEEKGPNLHRPYADLLDDGIHELRIKITGTQVRVLYFFCYQNIIVLTNVFDKNSDRVPKDQIRLAKKRRKDYIDRFSEEEIRRKT